MKVANASRVFVWAALNICMLQQSRAFDSPGDSAEIVRRLVEHSRGRGAEFLGYSGLRHYVVENKRFNVLATMDVRIVVDHSGSKHFTILQSTGPAAIRKMVFQRLLDTESAASAASELELTRISPDNYVFTLQGTATRDGEPYFVFDIQPKRSSPLLFRGTVWVDMSDFAIVRIEGSPAQSPSAWVKKTQFTHEYQRVGGQWLPVRNLSVSDVRVFGKTSVEIDYSDYALAERPLAK